jgi:hypothetical protein
MLPECARVPCLHDLAARSLLPLAGLPLLSYCGLCSHASHSVSHNVLLASCNMDDDAVLLCPMFPSRPSTSLKSICFFDAYQVWQPHDVNQIFFAPFVHHRPAQQASERVQ